MGSEAFWLMIGGIAQILIFLGVPTSAYIYYISQKSDNERFRRDEKDKFYAQLDNIYVDIQKILLEYPNLYDQNIHRSGEELTRYNTFAFIVWNFIESIHDYCLDDPNLRETWHCILVIESNLHSNWFNAEDNRKRFKHKFIEYIDHNKYTKTNANTGA